jgi:AraC family transcriptional regulator
MASDPGVLSPADASRNRRDGTDVLEFSVPPIGPLDPVGRARMPPMMPTDPAILNALRAIERDRVSALPIIPIDEIAAQAGLSVYHFQRRFNEVMGETVGAYARRLRLETAALLLQMTATPILQTAVAVGYNSAEAFTRAFQRQFGRSPSEYRAWARAMAVQPGFEEHARFQHISADWRDNLSLLAVRFFGSHARVGEYWQAFAELLADAGVDTRGKRLFGMSLDNPEITPRGLMRYDCAIEAPRELPPASKMAPFAVLSLPRTRVARIHHDGPYHSVFASYRAVIIWVPEKRHQFGDAPALEVYEELPWREGLGQPASFAVELAIV